MHVLQYPAELISGGWGAPEADGTGGFTRTWNDDSASLWLRWQDETDYKSIFYD